VEVLDIRAFEHRDDLFQSALQRLAFNSDRERMRDRTADGLSNLKRLLTTTRSEMLATPTGHLADGPEDRQPFWSSKDLKVLNADHQLRDLLPKLTP
jgi:hypothetical protein